MNIIQTDPTQQHIKMLLFGPSGSGKTWASTHLDESFGKMLYINFETKDASVEPGTDQVRITSRSELFDVYKHLTGPENEYEIIVLDSMTSYLNEVILHELANTNKNSKAARVVFADPELSVLAIGAWGIAGTQLTNTFITFKNLPMHVIFTALEYRDKDEQTGRVTLIPMFFGQMNAKAPAFVSHVGHMEADKEYQVRFKSSSFCYAKSEGGKLNEMEPANLNTIFNKILQGEPQ